MLKLSKTHNLKIAEENEVKDSDISGADVDGDDLEDGLSQEGVPDDELDDTEDELEAAKSPKFDARREAATPHAHAAKDLFGKRRELMGQVSMLDDQLAKHREVLRALDPKMKHEAYADDKELKMYLKPEKMIDVKKKKKKLDKKSADQVVDGLLKVAEVLDYAGDREGVSIVEDVLRIFAKDEGMPKYDVETIEKKKRKYPEIAPYAPTMSTRGCPDHGSAQMARVAEGSYQCSIDGRIYNWNEGFKDYSGNVFPAAPIRSIDMPNTTESMFETRQMAMNKKN